jgi:D-arabinose 1-dehydrogenase-like Zn-dependent alcohol dehydrogenase
VFDSAYSLENINKAHEKVSTSHAKGKVVIEVNTE